jgi:hypothetical protein
MDADLDDIEGYIGVIFTMQIIPAFPSTHQAVSLIHFHEPLDEIRLSC